jgi:nicotinamide riboside transporter PnuC
MFTLFTSVLLILFVVVLNIYYFYTWRLDERNEVMERTEQLAVHILKPQSRSGTTIAEETNRFIARIMDQ